MRNLPVLVVAAAALSIVQPIVRGDPSDVPPPAQPVFLATRPIDISGQHDFANAGGLNDEPATQLTGLCRIAEFRALPRDDRHVYAFNPWPSEKDALDKKAYTFNFRFGTSNVGGVKIAFMPEGGGPGGVTGLTRTTDPATHAAVLTGFGDLDWSGISTHVYKFDKPVRAFGVVLRADGDVDLRRFFWPAAVDLNGYPASYTLADGTVVQLGTREQRGALIKANTNAFVGAIDRSGCGIISFTYTLRGLAGDKAEHISMSEMAIATLPRPAAAPVINLKGSCDFDAPAAISPTVVPALPGLANLDTFRFIVGNHRYVYHFDTWPQSTAAATAASETFAFDLNARGEVGQRVTVTASAGSNNVKLGQVALKDDESQPYHALGGLGDLGDQGWATQTLKFEHPVWAAGVTYRSPGEANLQNPRQFPVSYTLSDGSTVNLGKQGSSGGTISANAKTFVGVVDDTDKGITSITFCVQGTGKAPQSIVIEDLAFAVAGPPPGNWKLTLSDDFNGDHLDPKIWSTGYKFADVINNELQGFVPENVTVANGVCTIKTEHRECKNTDRFGKQSAVQQFASGAFTSVDKFTQTFGYFEARIKMPKARGAGVWPAFWVLPDRGRDCKDDAVRYGYMNDAGRGMEIDIFEFMPRWKTLAGSFPIHMGCIWSYGPETEKDPAPHGYGGFARDNDGWGPGELDFPRLDDQFHTYGLYWSPERLIWYVDSKPVFRARDPKHMPNVPHFFLFNVSVQGNGWGKSPEKTDPPMNEIISDMPNQMDIDYFRAYSGTLEEAVPTPASDDPRSVARYTPPAAEHSTAAAGSAGSPPADTTQSAPPAPVNSKISSPSN